MSNEEIPGQENDKRSPQSRGFKIVLNRCDEKDCEKANKLSLRAIYPATLEFDQLKRYKHVVAKNINKQKMLIDKISRKNFKYANEVSLDVLVALSKNDLELLYKTRNSFDLRIAKLRDEIHQEMLGQFRSEDLQPKESVNSKK